MKGTETAPSVIGDSQHNHATPRKPSSKLTEPPSTQNGLEPSNSIKRRAKNSNQSGKGDSVAQQASSTRAQAAANSENTATDENENGQDTFQTYASNVSPKGSIKNEYAPLSFQGPNGSTDDRQQSTSGHQKRSSLPGATHSRRPSVQFAAEDRGDAQLPSYSKPSSRPSSKHSSVIGDDGDPTSKGKHSILGKLKAFAASSSSPAHARTNSGATDGGQANDVVQSASERGDYRLPGGLVDASDLDADADADAEESGGEQNIRQRKKKKSRRRWQQEDSEPDTAPTTPKLTARRPSFHFPRRANTTDLPPGQREGVSEDEGREILNREPSWRRRSTWLPGSRVDTQPDQEERRPRNLRRRTGLTGPSDLAASWRRHRADRAERGSSLSAQRWKQIKAGLKLIGQRRKADNTIDHAKSAELLAELASGVPAALILASMFQRDEHGSKRIPILLEQLKVRVTDSRVDSNSGDRHLVFKIELEYGNGMTRMKWVIHRTLKDFANLHLKYKLHFGTQKYIQMRSTEGGHHLPRFPRSAFPYLRGVRGLDSDAEDEEDDGGYDTAAEATSGNEGPSKKRKQSQHRHQRSVGSLSHRKSTEPEPSARTSATSGPRDAAGPSTPAINKKETFPERQRKKLEAYLQKMIRFLIFKPDSNRLCKFLELSALGVRLAAEGGYHGKEGFLIIQSSKGLDFRQGLTPSLMKKRHSPKWFLVRHSYIVCVDSPEEMNVYDVFLVDPYFEMQSQKFDLRNHNPKDVAKSAGESARHPQHHTLKLGNSERKLRLLARNERQLHQFEESIQFMVRNTAWSRPNRFDSFAPVRHKCFAQWIVDARDHMWVVSRAISQAKDVIYIHDWWLSPELYMRRPAAISQKWRLDRLLQQKAREGVKVFVIMYRNINSAIPIDSEYSKFSLLDLHPNIFVQRSPNQFRQNTFFWAHHEKLCIVDHTLAFIGGIDLCFGRWDTPQHTLTDDKPTGFESPNGPKDADHCQLWPGKDYSNPRIQDFYNLYKPYEEMYDRNVIPRMPWHDISMHVVGQPARDLTRHFVQRWNYILRQRKPTRPTPFLLPPAEFDEADLEALGLDGTCEVQLLRSSGMWSTGTPDVTEHSIMNAYVKLIEESEHFVHIENQFFITTCEVEGRKIENLIGDALVERIIRAAKNGEAWRAVIIIPLMPGFQNTVDSEGGTSVRLIMQCQYRSICRGETSIFGRLRAVGIEPEDYIQFFSLRAWGKIGPQKSLVTEQLYIHAKCMIVDDRAAIIGSANINERSMLGSRDSEVATIVRDTDMIRSTMNGRPYLVGRYPHTLRVRLMREHLGIDVDELMEHNLTTEELDRIQAAEQGTRPPHVNEEPGSDQRQEREAIERRHRIQDECLLRSEDIRSFNHDIDWEQGNNPNLKTNKKLTADSRVTGNPEHKKDVDGEGVDQLNTARETGLSEARDSQFLDPSREVLVSPVASEGKGTLKQPKRASPQEHQRDTKQGSEEVQPSPSADTTPSPGAPVPSPSDAENNFARPSPYQRPFATDVRHVFVDNDCMRDPVNDAFYLDTWLAVAEKNTRIFRTVFRCMPDSEVKSWKEYKEYAIYGERFEEMQMQQTSKPPQSPQTGQPSSPGTTKSKGQQQQQQPQSSRLKFDSPVTDEKSGQPTAELGRKENDNSSADPANQEISSPVVDEKSAVSRESDNGGTGEDAEKQPSSPQYVDYSEAVNLNANTQAWKRRRRAATHGSRREFHAFDEIMSKDQAEEHLNKVQGHLVLWPYEWFVLSLLEGMSVLILIGQQARGRRARW